MSTINLLYKHSYDINDKISVVIPKVGEILDDEDSYYNLVSTFTGMPIDYMVELDDAGIDFTEIDEYELFLLMFSGLVKSDTHLLLKDIDLSRFKFDRNPQNDQLILRDEENGIVIDRAIHRDIAVTLRKIHHLKQDRRTPANKEAKDYLLERARVKMRRRKNRKDFSKTEQLIVALVNCPEFKYDYEGVLNMTIYQFNESLQQCIKRVDYNNIMHGVYSGTIDTKGMSKGDLNWLVH